MFSLPIKVTASIKHIHANTKARCIKVVASLPPPYYVKSWPYYQLISLIVLHNFIKIFVIVRYFICLPRTLFSLQRNPKLMTKHN